MLSSLSCSIQPNMRYDMKQVQLAAYTKSVHYTGRIIVNVEMEFSWFLGDVGSNEVRTELIKRLQK